MAKKTIKQKAAEIDWASAAMNSGIAVLGGTATGVAIGQLSGTVDPMWTGLGAAVLGAGMAALGPKGGALGAAGYSMIGVAANAATQSAFPGLYGGATKVSGVDDEPGYIDDYEEYPKVNGVDEEGIHGVDDEGIHGVDEDDEDYE